MQVGRFWLITTNTIIGPWHVSSLNDGRGVSMGEGMKAGSWYVVNKNTGKSKRIGPVRLKGTNYCDKAKEEAVRRNALEGFEQKSTKHYDVNQVISEFESHNSTDCAAVALYDRGVREDDMSTDALNNSAFYWMVKNALRDIEKGHIEEVKLGLIRKWVKRHNF
jgi:hypothetical protein